MSHVAGMRIVETHSEEIERAIWRMHQRGDEIKDIIQKLANCEIHVTRKYVNLAVKRGNYILYAQRVTPVPGGSSSNMEELVEEQAVIEEEMGQTESSQEAAEVDDSSEIDGKFFTFLFIW